MSKSDEASIQHRGHALSESNKKYFGLRLVLEEWLKTHFAGLDESRIAMPPLQSNQDLFIPVVGKTKYPSSPSSNVGSRGNNIGPLGAGVEPATVALSPAFTSTTARPSLRHVKKHYTITYSKPDVDNTECQSTTIGTNTPVKQVQIPISRTSSSSPSNKAPSPTERSSRPSSSTTSSKTSAASDPTPGSRHHSRRRSSSFASATTIPALPIQEVHRFESCPHSSPPHNRPLNAQPRFTPNPAHNPLSPHRDPHAPPFIFTLPGPCHSCDTSRRRHLETSIISAYAAHIHPLKMELADLQLKLGSGADVDADAAGLAAELEREAGVFEEAGEAEVQAVWRGYSARWGPGTIGVTKGMGGRMKLAWIRPDMDAERERSNTRFEGLAAGWL